MDPSILVSAKGLYKSFGTNQAVSGVDFQIAAGEIYGLVGSDGAGKTTTMRLLVGAYLPTAGEASVCGYDLKTQPEQARTHIGYLSQRFSLYEDLTVLENIRFFAEMRGLKPDEWHPRSMEILEFVGLAKFQHRRAGQLSGGMKQKLGLASALVTRPRVLLLDEPLGALDLKLRKEMQIELKTLQSQVGITFIYVTHDQEEALTMSDRIAVMSHGKALQVGTPLEIYERPNCRFVADFIGETNFLDGTVTEVRGDFAYLTLPSGEVFSGRASEGVRAGTQATLSVRPEKMQLLENASTATANTYQVHVFSIAYVGSDTRVIINLGSQRIDVWEQNSSSTLNPDDYFFKSGESAWLTFKPENALVLAS